MKVLLFIRSLNRGGAEKQFLYLANGLANRGYSVKVLTFYKGSEDHKLHNNVEHICIGKTSKWDLLSGARIFYQFYRHRSYCIYSFLDMGNVIAAIHKLFFGFRLVWGIRASNMSLVKYTFLDKVLQKLMRFLSFLPDAIITNSYAGRDYFIDLKSPIHVVPNGIDCNFDYLKKVNTTKARRILYVARFDPIKNYPMLASVFHALHEIDSRYVLRVVGHGSDEVKNEFTTYLDKYDLLKKVEILDGNQMVGDNVYEEVDYLAQFSHSEGFPNVVLEALGRGVPVISHFNCGDSEAIVKNYGLILRDLNPQEAAKAIHIDANRLDQLSALEMQTYVKQTYTIQQMIDKSEEILRA